MNELWKNTPIYAYIDKNFDLCVHENTQDTGNLIGMPKPYTVPCVGGAFQEMYYWDTYFANVGLILCGKLEQAKNNVDDMLYMVERFGYMPNGNRTPLPQVLAAALSVPDGAGGIRADRR